MSYKSRDEIKIEDYSKKNVLIKLRNPNKFNMWDTLLTKAGATLTTGRDGPEGWIYPKKDIDRLENILYLNTENDSDEEDSYKTKKHDKHDKDDRDSKHYKSKYEGSEESDSYKSKNKTRSIPRKRDEEHDHSSDDDDELLQKTLCRKVMSESSQKVISDEEIINSDSEDVVSINRRMRHLYSVIKEQRTQIKKLEDLVYSNNNQSS
jgi:hypothetical protein